MSSLFFERPLTLMVCGLVLEISLGVALWLTGRAALLRAMLAVFVGTLLAIGLERLVVTDREQIDALLEHSVQRVLAHDTPGVLAVIDASAVDLRRTVTQMLSRGRVEELKITHQEIDVHSGAAPTDGGRETDRPHQGPIAGRRESARPGAGRAGTAQERRLEDHPRRIRSAGTPQRHRQLNGQARRRTLPAACRPLL